ncbi:potassium channel family protein [Riemerella anatipestifer]|uniref:Trka-n domain protein n=1 Tax=Riemerella anatipestifer (strain ATCC 11845 / DSM 15868 / JCM 9532 / NCTC 11014) TaxID=693978 RepID=E4TE20_RIEAD|nr:TrkA family potassium uptake protein [Riemerella anatipestifer]ADQ83029.1 TrkA-N domain protein [Riemerella anatipestifer ATCC 11845 = DSM 15868]ADZ11458.1 K+ transport systems, NAD-binding component [Riemerella anatipestifer RA-GD]AFD55094.1 trka-n domain protein [Riemerella anatipestifer ATCC 11845 = DSM 15868]MBT0550687.1 TrkA family potassium uptake protein [Riemerella anatipestifer]MBT0553609.1 TrkA family potassium uptake protein [Riemerella anatipestifer]
MKYIIVGLGNFGASLAQKLTVQGNEVIGIDNSAAKVDAYKEKISHTICMDSTDEFTVSGLPIKETDIFVVAIGEDQGANVMTTALLKNLQVKRLISRAINPLHEKVLQAIGVDEIVHPEEETAERWAKKLCLSNVVDSFELNQEYSIIEAKVPEEYIGKTIREIDFRKKYNLAVLTIIRKVEVKSLLGKTKTENKVLGVAATDTLLETNDILVIYGSNKDLKGFLKQKMD